MSLMAQKLPHSNDKNTVWDLYELLSNVVVEIILLAEVISILHQKLSDDV